MIVNQTDLDKLCSIEPVFKQIINTYGSPPQWKRPEGFASLARIILEQQVSLDSANAAYKKLTNYIGELTPSSVVKLSPDEWKSNSISRQKARYIRLLAQGVINQELDMANLGQLPMNEAKEILLAQTGIGPWTTEVYILFCLQQKDIFPPGDIALIRTVIELFEVEKEGVIPKSVEWQPYRSLASFLLWHYYLSKRGRSITYD